MVAKKVLIVDDSLTMRALFTSALERSKDLIVVGAASDAFVAAEMIAELKPDVLTLDIEMPGKNGIEFLEELMATKPMPVIMLSTLTQKGADISLRAIELGAVDCFPKPQKATPEEFEKISDKLCKIVATAAKTNMMARRKGPTNVTKVASSDYQWGGSIIAVSAGMGGTEAISQMLEPFPANCPPVIVLHPLEDGLAVPFASKLNASIAPEVKIATDGMALEQGKVYLAADSQWHIGIDRWPQGHIRFIDRDPVNGHRPSADLLFTVLAKLAKNKADAVILTGGGADGAMGMVALNQAGARTFCQDVETALIHEAASAAVAKGGVQHQLAPSDLGVALLNEAERRAAA